VKRCNQSDVAAEYWELRISRNGSGPARRLNCNSRTQGPPLLQFGVF
jgi:hypothetical protein